MTDNQINLNQLKIWKSCYKKKVMDPNNQQKKKWKMKIRSIFRQSRKY